MLPIVVSIGSVLVIGYAEPTDQDFESAVMLEKMNYHLQHCFPANTIHKCGNYFDFYMSSIMFTF